ncbi:PE38 [Dione juno nucleopolyhedrovirus]|uniref:PE38 n=1 Tax=Dione juno nucleopolyhedrovirus TaxID=2594175 RepID=A0AAE6H422_9ABAC|nr:PE38 [Dione juno nucleopolyhedrovirus]QDL57007.1 PE38 [Dione juno nucleopolyhedrovirus]
MSSRLASYKIRNASERRRVQAQLLQQFKRAPVTPLTATCSVCLEDYTMQSNNITEMLMPVNCTHVFCYKCVLQMYNNAMNVPHATINCPMCKIKISTWQSFFPESVVSCKFIKKTGDRVPACVQFKDAVNIIKQRYASSSPSTSSSSSTSAVYQMPTNSVHQNVNVHTQQLIAANQEVERLKKTLDDQAAAHDTAFNSLFQQMVVMQNKLTDVREELNRSKVLNRILTHHDRANKRYIDELKSILRQYQTRDENCVSTIVEFNTHARQNTVLHDRFRTQVYSVLSNMMIEDRIKNLQSSIFGTTILPCTVNVDVLFHYEDQI